MNLGDLITRLEAAHPNQTVPHGFHNPHSYRGDYMDLAFEPAHNITVAAMLEAARSALGTTYQGYKGGQFTMDANSWCWLSEEGDASGETISALLLDLMLSQPTATHQPATPDTEDPARIDRLRPEFTEHSSVEAIDIQLDRARRQERRWHIRVEWLVGLRQRRVEQQARDDQPAESAAAPAKEA
ncbi:hypothetical protein SUDANB145_07248 (plasmid) [Streptomyces sp. enrichment culture]|uniref:hypothetical protein n=1 Tax=Streptomyces sp. enrichment culture TaxID=1795815 RepID=UPI003F558DB9